MKNGYKVYDVDTHVMPIAEVLERYVDPNFRPRLVELAPYRVPAGPAPDATERHQATYVGGTAPLKHRPSDYLASGRFFGSIEMHEGEDMFNCVTGFLGEDVLMYASDYPHPECHFPNSVEHVLGWSSLKPETQRNLLWRNATPFFSPP